MHNILISLVFSVLMLLTSTAFADTIANRFGITGRIGLAYPIAPDFMDDEFINGTSDTKSGIAWNGGFIYGFTDHLAAELEISYLPELDVEVNGVKAYEAELIDYSLGLQYRFTPTSALVPFVGAGVDMMQGNLTHENGNSYDLDWAYGGHVNAGLDWFLTRGIALTADLRGTIAASGDINRGSTKVSEYDPFWIQGTVGVRLILPEKW